MDPVTCSQAASPPLGMMANQGGCWQMAPVLSQEATVLSQGISSVPQGTSTQRAPVPAPRSTLSLCVARPHPFVGGLHHFLWGPTPLTG